MSIRRRPRRRHLQVVRQATEGRQGAVRRESRSPAGPGTRRARAQRRRKTTAVRVLTTLIKPDRGRAEVEGLDVVRQAAEVRKVIGLAGQFAAVDENLTGRENVEMVGTLYHLGSKVPRRGRRGAGAPAAERRRRSARAHLLGRYAPPARPRRQPRRPAEGPAARRADHGARSAQPHRAVGFHP